MTAWLQRAWYGERSPLWLLAPLEWLFKHLAAKRRRAYQTGAKQSYRAPVPVIIVGNISVGGTGKTPFTLWLLEQLKNAGYRPGVVSRGYGAKPSSFPYVVTNDSPPQHAGDEPLLLAQRSGCPLVIDPDRPRAVRQLLEQFDCDLIVSDDGLQHYALERDLEIALIDAQRGLGNGRCLPLGPLREPPERLDQVDYVVYNGLSEESRADVCSMQLQPGSLRTLDGKETKLAGQPVHAVAGIGNPERFFETLSSLGYQPHPHPFSDHHHYRPEELEFEPSLPVIMTEKDAVKCRAFSLNNGYYLPVSAQLPEPFRCQLLERVEQLVNAARTIKESHG